MRNRSVYLVVCWCAVLCAGVRPVTGFARDDGYRGTWFALREIRGAHGDKYAGERRVFREITRSDHNHDMAFPCVAADGTWPASGPMMPGPRPYGTGETVAWTDSGRGRARRDVRKPTTANVRHHSHARRPMNAHPEFCAFRADGDAFKPFPSHLYFANNAGDDIHVLPESVDGQFAAPPPWPTGETRQIPIARGWARNAVNAVIFRQHAVTTHGDKQYVAFYDEQGRMVLGKRSLGSSDWELHTTDHKGDVRDAHNTICIAVDGAGVLHVAWDHHGSPLHYARSVRPGALDLTEPMPMTGHDEQHVTYPEFYNLADGGLLFLYRSGGSGRGNTMLNRYDPASGAWSVVQHPLIDGQGQRNAYTNQIAIDGAGAWHLSWCWRETGDVASNHDLCYARSTDQGHTWTRSDRVLYTLPITAATAEVACPVPQKHELINQCATAVDSHGRPLIATYWRPEGTNVPQYHLVWHDGKAWRTAQIGQRKTPFSLSGVGTKRIPISRPKLAVDARDRVYMLFRDADRGGRVSVAACDDPSRKTWRVTDLTGTSVGLWEPAYDVQLWRARGVMHVLTQRVGQGDAETLEDVPPQMISILEWNPE